MTAETSASPAQRVSPTVTLMVLAVAGTAYSLLQSLVLPILPTLQKDLHTTQDNVTWVLTAYLLSASVATPILGRLGDLLGKRRVLVWVLAALSIGCVICALATNVPVMLVGRVIQGAGGAIFPLAFGIIRDEFPAKKVAGAIGTISSLLAVGGGAGIVLGGPITDTLNYHWLFWVPLPFVAACTVLTHFVIPDSPAHNSGSRINVVGAVLLSVWLVALLVAVSEGPIWGWWSVRTVALYAVTVISAVWWVRSEATSATPLVDMQMMRRPVVWRANLIAFLVGIVMYSIFAALPAFVQTPHSAGYGFAASVTASGLFLLPLTVAMFFSGQLVGRLTHAYGSKLVTVAGSIVAAVAMFALAIAHSQRWEIYMATAVLGLGMGLVFSAMSNLIVESVPMSQTGVAAGMNANIRTIGGSIGAQVGAVLITAGVVGDAIPKETGYSHAFIVLAVSAALAVLVAVTVPRSRAHIEIDFEHQLDEVIAEASGEGALAGTLAATVQGSLERPTV